jgi:hypothetical protein
MGERREKEGRNESREYNEEKRRRSRKRSWKSLFVVDISSCLSRQRQRAPSFAHQSRLPAEDRPIHLLHSLHRPRSHSQRSAIPSRLIRRRSCPPHRLSSLTLSYHHRHPRRPAASNHRTSSPQASSPTSSHQAASAPTTQRAQSGGCRRLGRTQEWRRSGSS